MNVDAESIRELVATASRVLAANEQDDFIWGHASIRDPEDRGIWIKHAGWSLAEITSEHVHLVDAGGEVVAGDGAQHSEYPIHTEIMRARPDVGAVVHTHPPYAVALGATGQPLRPVSHAANFFVPPEVPRFTRTADLILTPELGSQVADTLGSNHALLLANHGIVTVGPDMQTAVVRAVVLEQAAKQQLLTHQMGGWPAWSDEAESITKRGHIYSPRAVQAVWEYLVRNL